MTAKPAIGTLKNRPKKKGLFRQSQNPANKAQVAAFLIAIIVVLLAAIMVTVNLGKVSLTKTKTANAADAGALAGATVYDQTLNNLAYANAVMISSYFAQQLTFLIPISICQEKWRFASWVAFSAGQAAEFFLAGENGKDGYIEARNSAKQIAFSNVGVDQPKPGRSQGQTYEEWLKDAKSPYEEWVEAEKYKRDVSGPATYPWQDRPKYGQTVGGKNSVTVDAQGPDFPGLIPMPGVLVGVFRDGPFPIFECTCSLACFLKITAYANCLLAVKSATVQPDPRNTRPNPPGGCIPCDRLITWNSPGGLSHKGIPFFPSTAFCGMVVWNIGIYPVPIVSIANILEDNPSIIVTVNKVEPEANLGLWTMKYDDPQRGPGKGISSRAAAKAEGGAVGPWPSEKYDAHLIEGGY